MLSPRGWPLQDGWVGWGLCWPPVNPWDSGARQESVLSPRTAPSRMAGPAGERSVLLPGRPSRKSGLGEAGRSVLSPREPNAVAALLCYRDVTRIARPWAASGSL